jgi:hypothetical protein
VDYATSFGLVRLFRLVDKQHTEKDQRENNTVDNEVGPDPGLVAVLPVKVDESLHKFRLEEAHVLGLCQLMDEADL